MKQKIFKSIGIVCGAGIFAAALLFSAQTLGYMDWQTRTTPGNPASGFMRTWANSSNNFGCLTSAGATCTVDPAATTSALGVVKTDGSTISNSAGLISCTTSTTSQLGCVKPDGTTITVSGGVISASGGGGGGVATGAYIAATTSQSVANNSSTQINLGTVVRDDGGFTGTANALTVPAGKDGWYIITGSIFWPSNATGVRNAELFIGGAAQSPRAVTQSSSSAFASEIASQVIYLAAGQVVTLAGFQNSGGSISTSSAWLSIAFIN